MFSVKSWSLATFLSAKYTPLSIEVTSEGPIFWFADDARPTKQIFHGIVAELNAAVRKAGGA